MTLSGTYKTQHGDLTITQEGEKITATYQDDGVCNGKLSGNKVDGIWKNKKDQGIFEWNFDDKGSFTGKYKSGTDQGPMRGKWNGKLASQEISESDDENKLNDNVEITLSGRIPKYFFGRVKALYQDELKTVLSISDESIETEQDFLQTLLKTTLEEREAERKNFRDLVPMDQLEENCPELFKLLEEIEEYDLDHFGLYDAIFDTAEYWQCGTGFISFFEDDCKISISINGNEVIKDKSFGEFAKNESSYHTENIPENDNEKHLFNSLKKFIEVNSEEFGLPEDIGIGINNEGSTFCETWFTPPSFESICERDFSVTILHNDIIDYTFYIETEKFDFKKLMFLTYANYADFRENSLTTLANYIAYDNEIIQPDESWHRDKGIELEYEPKSCTIDFLING